MSFGHGTKICPSCQGYVCVAKKICSCGYAFRPRDDKASDNWKHFHPRGSLRDERRAADVEASEAVREETDDSKRPHIEDGWTGAAGSGSAAGAGYSSGSERGGTGAASKRRRSGESGGGSDDSGSESEEGEEEGSEDDENCASAEVAQVSRAQMYRELKQNPGTYPTLDQLGEHYNDRPDVWPGMVCDITPEMAAVSPVTDDVVLAALEHVDFPEDRTRSQRSTGPGRRKKQNPGARAKQQQPPMCLGAIRAWKRNCFGYAGGVVGDNGVIASGHAQGRPQLAKLLSRYMRRKDGDFHFTSIQVSKNYDEIAMRVDNHTLGPSYTIGLGDFAGGELWCVAPFVVLNGTALLPLSCLYTLHKLLGLKCARHASMYRKLNW